MSIHFTASPIRKYQISGDGSNNRAIDVLKFLLDDYSVVPKNFDRFSLCYGEKYPLRFIGENDELWVSLIKGDDEVKKTVEALQLMEFSVTTKIEEVISKKKSVTFER